MRGVRILGMNKRLLSSETQTGSGVHTAYTSMGTVAPFSASCWRRSLTCGFSCFVRSIK
jgi:hypothetical protein